MSVNPHCRFDRCFQFDGFFRTATGRERYHDSGVPQRSDAQLQTPVAHALLCAASTLVSMSAKRRHECRRSTQECVRHGRLHHLWRASRPLVAPYLSRLGNGFPCRGTS
jgi:hypothetical protein